VLQVLGERQRNALGHPAENNRVARDSIWRIRPHLFDELFRTLSNFQADRIHELLMWAILDSGYWLCLLLAMPAAGCLFMI
jgi:hypothetical protein